MSNSEVGVGAGLSPRGRGNLLAAEKLDLGPRSIPAWAGQPAPGPARPGRSSVYPRVGGATRRWLWISSQSRGLSPRGRGNLHHVPGGPAADRSIPAWAGQPIVTVSPTIGSPVYPRVGGATTGVYEGNYQGNGLSPRGRGNQLLDHRQQSRQRSIPAWAGQPTTRPPTAAVAAVYPRVGGATSGPGVPRETLIGLSPRGRGNLAGRPLQVGRCGSIPAWAGQPPACGFPWHGRKVYPRVGGATFQRRVSSARDAGLSPRGRGNLGPLRPTHRTKWSIPAWAGQPVEQVLAGLQGWVYPRVGGATGLVRLQVVGRLGLSPRGRGNRVAGPVGGHGDGSIPAWAGQPIHR